MRVVALDIGQRRIGIAVGDTQTRIAFPVKVLSTKEVLDNAPAWRSFLQDEKPEVLVAGLPKSMNGYDSYQAQRVRGVAERIAKACGLALEFSDERLSSIEAKRVMHEQGFSEREMRGKLDMVAASLFLQVWLDQHA